MVEKTETLAPDQKVVKSRHLSILDYYETLQVEYLVAELRHKIFPRLKDKEYWNKVKTGKKATIIKLSENNKLPSIFSDSEMLREFENKIYRPVSYPRFTYKDADNEQAQSYYDLKYYYNIESDVRVDIENEEIKTGKISREFIPFRDTSVWVKIAGVESKFPVKQVTRIL